MTPARSRVETHSPPVLDRAVVQTKCIVPLDYSRSSRPVSLMKRLSRLGCVHRHSPAPRQPAAASVAQHRPASLCSVPRPTSRGSARSRRRGATSHAWQGARARQSRFAISFAGSKRPVQSEHVTLGRSSARSSSQRAGGDDLAVVDDREAVAQLLRLLHVVGGVDDAGAGVGLDS